MINLNKNSAGGKIVVTFSAQAGSTGKGSLNAWLADKYGFDLATNNWAVNAGHYIQLDDGRRFLNQHICSSFINPNTQLYINAGASINLKTLFNEIDILEKAGFNIKDRLSIHPLANVITEEDKNKEKEIIKSGSTFKGCGAALARKTLRIPGQKLAKDYDELIPFVRDRTHNILTMIRMGAKIIVEGSQGIDLDINHAEWPFCTSRQTIPQQLIADAGIPFQAVTNLVSDIRTNPIRINNISAANDKETCYTGNYWDAKEITWQDIAKQAGYETYEEFEKEYGFALMTSVTKKVRRVFEFPIERMRFCNAIVGGNLPNSNVLYSLNFINFVDKNVKGVKTIKKLTTNKVNEWLNNNLFKVINKDQLKWVRTGPNHSEIVEMD